MDFRSTQRKVEKMRYQPKRDPTRWLGFFSPPETDLICPLCGETIWLEEEAGWRGRDLCHKECLEKEEEMEHGSEETG